ncbi:tubulin folding cofactor E-like L homeolog isoform X1 [Xenopus laevis]|uniref:Leucine-rich repeat-containing protein 51 n=3 Tax=Xenopus laevis TaxID=8355 RepID=A0A8J0T6G8_XENLA|nr:tubulin folding cofactor E-like L homeolog isoform X1 [Xenopus laevis]
MWSWTEVLSWNVVTMDPSCGRSFMQVLCEKYSPENFPYRRGPGAGVHVPPGPQVSPMKDRLNLPSILVINSCGINCAGDESEIAAFCSHVSELDLSGNKLDDWEEVSKIVSSVPQLQFLNLSSNPLHLSVLGRSCAGTFASIRKLVLNNCKASWETVHTLLMELPELEELFLCLNDYNTVLCSPVCYRSLKLLHITDNNLQDWSEIRKLGTMFPCLDTLVLANNNLSKIEDSEESLPRLFPKLRSISLHKAGLNSWRDIEKLNALPKLEEVRLLGIPLVEPYTTEERRKLVIARLPSVSKLNGSVVTDGEREDSERFFLRYYMNLPKEDVPLRYQELVTKYGKLEPLVEVDLRPQNKANVYIHFEEKVETMSIRLDQTVAEFKKQLKNLVQLSTNNMRLYFLDHEAPFGPEEMKSSTRRLHSYNVHDGDKFYVEPKIK